MRSSLQTARAPGTASRRVSSSIFAGLVTALAMAIYQVTNGRQALARQAAAHHESLSAALGPGVIALGVVAALVTFVVLSLVSRAPRPPASRSWESTWHQGYRSRDGGR
jgi:hypothetical protein